MTTGAFFQTFGLSVSWLSQYNFYQQIIVLGLINIKPNEQNHFPTEFINMYPHGSYWLCILCPPGVG